MRLFHSCSECIAGAFAESYYVLCVAVGAAMTSRLNVHGCCTWQGSPIPLTALASSLAAAVMSSVHLIVWVVCLWAVSRVCFSQRGFRTSNCGNLESVIPVDLDTGIRLRRF